MRELSYFQCTSMIVIRAGRSNIEQYQKISIEFSNEKLTGTVRIDHLSHWLKSLNQSVVSFSFTRTHFLQYQTNRSVYTVPCVYICIICIMIHTWTSSFALCTIWFTYPHINNLFVIDPYLFKHLCTAALSSSGHNKYFNVVHPCTFSFLVHCCCVWSHSIAHSGHAYLDSFW